MKNSTVRILVIIVMMIFVGGSSYWFCHLVGKIDPILEVAWVVFCAIPYGWYSGKLTMEWLDRNYPLDEY